MREFGDKSHEVTHISLGTYKKTDEYMERKGMAGLTETGDDLGGVSVRLSGESKEVEVDPLIVRAAQRWGIWRK